MRQYTQKFILHFNLRSPNALLIVFTKLLSLYDIHRLHTSVLLIVQQIGAELSKNCAA